MVAPHDPPEWLATAAVAEAAGTSEDDIREWQRLGLLHGASGRHPLDDVERARLIAYARRRGVAPSEIAAVSRRRGDVLGQFVAFITDGTARLGHTRDQTAAASGFDGALLERLRVAAGLGDQVRDFDDDIGALRSMRAALDHGLPEDALVQLVRVFADAMRRAAEAEAHAFHHYVYERLRAEGLSGADLMAATNRSREDLQRLAPPVLMYFHTKAFQRALRDDFVVHVTEASELPSGAAGTLTMTILFADLSGFTPLAESMGDAAAATVVERFSHLVRAVLAEHTGTLVKQIGDAFMLAFADQADAIACALDIHDAIDDEAPFPAVRIGGHHGSLLYRDGDYLGTTVNIAARVAALAVRHQTLVTSELRDAAGLPLEGRDLDVERVGPTALKGISTDVTLYAVRRRRTRPDRVVDPVCHMVLEATAAAAVVQWRGDELSFCSSTCAERFFADPDAYAAAPR